MANSSSSKRTSASDKASEAFTADEKAAMKERTREQRAAARRGAAADGEQDLLAKIAEMPEADRVMAEKIHQIVTAAAPDLAPKTWYGQPAYAKDGKVVCSSSPRPSSRPAMPRSASARRRSSMTARCGRRLGR